MAIVYRAVKGRELTNAEVDANFSQLANGSIEGFKQSGTDVERSWLSKSRDVVSIEDYGSDGTALAGILALGRRVLIPSSITSLTLTSGQVATVLGGLRLISPEAALTINLPVTDQTLSSTITPGGPFSHLITVKGATMTSTAITAATNTTPGAGAHEVTFTVTSSAAFTVGGFAIVKSIVGTGRERVLGGCWEVLAKPSGTSIRLKVKARKATLPDLSGLSSGTMLAVGTILRFSGISGIAADGRDCGTFQNMCVAGNDTGANVWGVYLFKKAVLRLSQSTSFPFAVVNFGDHGIYCIEGSHASCFDSYTSGNGGAGLLVGDGSSANAVRLAATGNASIGASASNFGFISGSTGNYSGNGSRGVNATGNGRFVATSSVVYENDDSGVRADTGAIVDVTSAKIAGNAAQGIRAYGGRVTAISADYTGDNGAANEQVEYNGTIDTSSTAQTNFFLMTPYTVATLPAASSHDFGLVFVSDETDGATMAFSDGTNWRRVQDREIVS